MGNLFSQSLETLNFTMFDLATEGALCQEDLEIVPSRYDRGVLDNRLLRFFQGNAVSPLQDLPGAVGFEERRVVAKPGSLRKKDLADSLV